ncbi:L-dehydroascorbate transporter large permease subunit [Caulobacter sp. D4A]|uniref:TRAP transporter large permease subunit n=1 Tax=Caulobacter sp. D4A TaxID=2204171 RepID=UPI000D72B3DF|nr:TRAP transporter large permease subunit [Caulobacter sp. D4A]PXA85232.1 L-dehydroascorbate transporter large permease subunit [Caulobacter sp. D4A]
MTIFVFVGSLCGAMLLGIPVAFSLLICGVVLMMHLDIFDVQILAENVLDGANNYPLMALPFFVLAGEIMNAGGVSKRIVNVAIAAVGHFRGGLGYVAVFAALILAAISGSAIADCAALAAVVIPLMRRSGYPVPLSAGLISSAGIVAPLLPPSIPFVVFGVAAELSVTRLFMTGIAPGLMMAATLMVTWYFYARKDERMASGQKFELSRLLTALKEGIWALVLPAIIIGGMKTGIFTPTEAGVVAVVYAFIIGMFVYGELKISIMPSLLLQAAKTASTIMFLVAAAYVSAWLITVANIPQEIGESLAPYMENKTLFMFMLMVIVFLVGTALDLTPTILILTPVMMPLVKQAGIDPYYFGVMFMMNNAIGLITPPVGTVLNVVSGVARVELDQVIKGMLPFLIAYTVLLFTFVIFPELITVPAGWLR